MTFLLVNRVDNIANKSKLSVQTALRRLLV